MSVKFTVIYNPPKNGLSWLGLLESLFMPGEISSIFFTMQNSQYPSGKDLQESEISPLKTEEFLIN